MSLRRQQQRAREQAQGILEELHPGTVIISGEEYAVATSGVRLRKYLDDGREIERRQMSLRLRKCLHPNAPAIGKVITFEDEDGEKSEWRIAGLDGHASDIAWGVTCYEPSDERAS